MDTRVHALYFGMVQGVGFRYTVRGFASQLGLKGWVKNLRDGRVETIAEGEKESVEEFLRQIESHFTGYIKNREINYEKPLGDFDDFSITY